MFPSQRESHRIVASGVESLRYFSADAHPAEPRRFDAGNSSHRIQLKPSDNEFLDKKSIQPQSADIGGENHEAESSSDARETPQMNDTAPRRRPKRMIDWRAEICTFLSMPYEISDNKLVKALDEASETMQEIEQLRKQASDQRGPPRCQVIHDITCHRNRNERGVFLDPPTVVNYGPQNAHARSSHRMDNMGLFLERNKEIIFLVVRQYECCGPAIPDKRLLYQDSTEEMNIKALLKHEFIDIISSDLRQAIHDLGQSLGDVQLSIPDNEHVLINAPYLWWFHRRNQIQVVTSAMQPYSRDHINVFERYLQDSYGNEWEIVDKLLESKRIAARFLQYLFVPDEVILSRSTTSRVASLEGFWLQDWAKLYHREGFLVVELHSSHWTFDERFERREKTLILDKVPWDAEDLSIADLAIYPGRFANPETVRALRERGRMFWKCRQRHYVSALNQYDSSLQGMAHSRFMVDMKTYNEMHPRGPDPQVHKDYILPRRYDPRNPYEYPASHNKEPEYLDAAKMVEDDPDRVDLGNDFFMCLPAEIVGFNMQRKAWEKLQVADIQDVEWNEKAFDLLVLEQRTKDLVQAVMTNRLRAGEQTDVIHGKGNGLFLLLHGGPGTGKTLTAESVAEVAKRPLYRVTCGDIGTKADEVEKYLESVLMLGKIWECIVLLDEADVFLEHRKLHHLERNALVSVFLRVLESYDGILILTSNRVGTFDAAFKSRIQLSLRYKNLGKKERRQIWSNFIGRLEDLVTRTHGGRDVRMNVSGMHRNVDIGIDTDDIRKHLDELASYDINGREIRNAISTARQLAMFRDASMNYGHLLEVIDEANKFQTYIKDLNHGFTADEISKDRGERYYESETEQ